MLPPNKQPTKPMVERNKWDQRVKTLTEAEKVEKNVTKTTAAAAASQSAQFPSRATAFIPTQMTQLASALSPTGIV